MFHFTTIEAPKGERKVIELRWYKTRVGYLIYRGTYQHKSETWELVRLPDFQQIMLFSGSEAQAVAHIKAIGPSLFDCGKEFVVRVESYLGVVLFITDVAVEYDVRRYKWAWKVDDAKSFTRADAREIVREFRLDGIKNEFGDYYVKATSIDKRTGLSAYSGAISEEYVALTKSMLLTSKPLADILKPSEFISRHR